MSSRVRKLLPCESFGPSEIKLLQCAQILCVSEGVASIQSLSLNNSGAIAPRLSNNDPCTPNGGRLIEVEIESYQPAFPLADHNFLHLDFSAESTIIVQYNTKDKELVFCPTTRLLEACRTRGPILSCAEVRGSLQEEGG